MDGCAVTLGQIDERADPVDLRVAERLLYAVHGSPLRPGGHAPEDHVLTRQCCEEDGQMAVELAELIGQLRAELTKAMSAGEGADLRFEIGPVELELTVAVNKEAKPGAKVRFWVVELGADISAASGSTQRIKLTLDPRRAGQSVGRPLISGEEEIGER
jgi:hypothetical protein